MTKEEIRYHLNNIIVDINLYDLHCETKQFSKFAISSIFKISDTFFDNEKYFKYFKRIRTVNELKVKTISFTSLYIELEVGIFNYVIEFDFWGDYANGIKYDEVEFLSMIEECFQKLTNLARA